MKQISPFILLLAIFAGCGPNNAPTYHVTNDSNVVIDKAKEREITKYYWEAVGKECEAINKRAFHGEGTPPGDSVGLYGAVDEIAEKKTMVKYNIPIDQLKEIIKRNIHAIINKEK